MTDGALLRLDVRRPRPGRVIVAVHGEVDMLTAPDLALGLEQHLDGTGTLVVDLSEVVFFGAAGLEVLLHIQTEARRRGMALQLVTGPHLQRLLHLVDLDRALPLHDAR